MYDIGIVGRQPENGDGPKVLPGEGPNAFAQKTNRQAHETAKTESDLFEQIGRLKMELEWLKKRLPASLAERRAMIEAGHGALSIRRQCDLLGVSRASYYYTPATELALTWS